LDAAGRSTRSWSPTVWDHVLDLKESFRTTPHGKTRERFMGIGQVLTMPIFFASNAIYPLSLMPGCPLTY
jgi:hypothetical protein